MTLRDYFAAAALTGFLASFAVEGSATPTPNVAARKAYDFADAMLAIRAGAAAEQNSVQVDWAAFRQGGGEPPPVPGELPV